MILIMDYSQLTDYELEEISILRRHEINETKRIIKSTNKIIIPRYKFFTAVLIVLLICVIGLIVYDILTCPKSLPFALSLEGIRNFRNYLYGVLKIIS